jgi:hypothetical protein
LLKGFKKWGDEQESLSKRNPFNQDYDPTLLVHKKGEEGYGQPVGPELQINLAELSLSSAFSDGVPTWNFQVSLSQQNFVPAQLS